jgi:predicted nucleotidyltransferase
MKHTKEKVIGFLKEHKADFASEFSVRKLGIFGSYARNEAREDSDIDIVVELEKPDLFSLIGIKQSLEESFNTKVDVIRLRNNMNEVLRKRIEKDVIYV